MESIISAIRQKVSINAEVEANILKAFTKEEIPKNHEFLREDQYADRLGFLEKGIIRSYYYYQDKEVTSWLYNERQFFTSWYSFIERRQSFEYLQALEQSTIYWISRDKYNDLLSENPILERFGRLFLEEQIAFIDFFYKGFLYMSAREKYDLLLSVFPDVTLRVNLGHIASLLGISQETLSRIRNQKRIV